MKATTLLRDQHCRLGRLLTRVASERHLRMPLVLELVEELLTHLSVEDHLFLYPVADSLGVHVGTYRDEHARLRNAVLQVVFAEADDNVFAKRLTELASAFEHHASTFERDLIALVDSQLRVDELETIGDRMQTFWDAAVGTERTGKESHVHAAE